MPTVNCILTLLISDGRPRSTLMLTVLQHSAVAPPLSSVPESRIRPTSLSVRPHSSSLPYETRRPAAPAMRDLPHRSHSLDGIVILAMISVSRRSCVVGYFDEGDSRTGFLLSAARIPPAMPPR